MSVSGGLAFLDTNVLVYSVDRGEPAKRARALELLGPESEFDGLVCSVQVLGEFFNASRRKLAMSVEDARDGVERYARLARVLVDRELVTAAIALCAEKPISYWDALIVAAAARAGATTLLTEDLNDGEEMLGVQIVNPFAGL
jgi:predicted nucleic acid-binding protein